MIFIPYKGNQFTGEPILLKEEELSKYPIVERKTRYEYGSVRSNCTKKEIFRKTYETCIYNVEGNIVTGKECFKEEKWVPKNWLKKPSNINRTNQNSIQINILKLNFLNFYKTN